MNIFSIKLHKIASWHHVSVMYPETEDKNDNTALILCVIHIEGVMTTPPFFADNEQDSTWFIGFLKVLNLFLFTVNVSLLLFYLFIFVIICTKSNLTFLIAYTLWHLSHRPTLQALSIWRPAGLKEDTIFANRKFQCGSQMS